MRTHERHVKHGHRDILLQAPRKKKSKKKSRKSKSKKNSRKFKTNVEAIKSKIAVANNAIHPPQVLNNPAQEPSRKNKSRPLDLAKKIAKYLFPQWYTCHWLIKQLDLAQKEMRYLFGRVGKFETEQQTRVHGIRLDRQYRVVNGIIPAPLSLELDWEHDEEVMDVEEGRAVCEGGYEATELTSEIRFLKKQLVVEAALSGAVMLRLERFGGHMGLEGGDLSCRIGDTTTSKYLAEVEPDSKLAAVAARSFLADIVTGEFLALDKDLSPEPKDAEAYWQTSNPVPTLIVEVLFAGLPRPSNDLDTLRGAINVGSVAT
ncbi:uncharacterized protein LY89DRAFT_752783 [Mollisia scopiformis]|uniref:Uncharacterized protein n=1 Tax=Mollisia scopiformis TaxID=149040 RepID=A0A194X0F3_MOLSC|nr:uncharacterized protein LY89DRAFT_752783 [Mollisia scopiformis]KUJ13675.1 hypothetical protein LY89DRAFT_752783 [Mollisia scopiformis]